MYRKAILKLYKDLILKFHLTFSKHFLNIIITETVCSLVVWLVLVKRNIITHQYRKLQQAANSTMVVMVNIL